jgi:hypothetical protein
MKNHRVKNYKFKVRACIRSAGISQACKENNFEK